MKHFFAFDLGATSGRSIIGTLSNGKLEIKELTRFPNNILHIGNKYYWNIYSLYEELKRGLKTAHTEGYTLSAIGIDTWGVDFVYVAADGSLLGCPRSYRDPYTDGAPEEFFAKIPKKDVYQATGIQTLNFNSIFQLFAAKKENSSALNHAETMLFIPDALSYLLTGKKICEYSIASTSQFVNAKTKKIEKRFFESIGINTSIVPDIVPSGTIIGTLLPALAQECGVGQVPVIAVAGHDTGSAVAAIPAESKNFAYLSSGTWSLMGIEVSEPIITDESFELNFTNEGGIDNTIRFLKNITGMWLLEQCRKEWEAKGKTYGYSEIVDLCAMGANFKSIIDPDHTSFANPQSMTQAIVDYCRNSGQHAPQTEAEFIYCIFNSLSNKYKIVLENLRKVAPFPIEKLHIIGGGSKNNLLNQMTANAIGFPVVAGPGEATAIGNIMVQAKALNVVDSLDRMREIIRNSVEIAEFLPL
ncbi:MAG: rhamnulokinase [Bacteroidales bacterium]|jgi:rhamnulokinase|nr:rhamnulokinase [Bacteroidales bacterium]